MRSKLMAALIGALAITVAGGGYAAADALITGKKVKNGSLSGSDVKNGSITNKDIKKGTIRLDRLSKGTQALIRKTGGAGKTGAQGPQGPAGPGGVNGAGVGGAGTGNGTVLFAGPNWGTIFRNTIGSPDISLTGGPNTPTSTPPFGVGSLTFTVADGVDSGTADAEKASFGNEVDFAGKPFNGLDQLGFRVFTTGEDAAKGNPNMPNIAIEIDPNLSISTSNFSTLTYLPPQSTSNQWSGYIDATTTAASPTGTGFILSGDAGTKTNCNLATPCTFAQVKAALNDGGDGAVVGSVAVVKGRDFAFQGAVDGLRVSGLGNGDQTFDFEPSGTTAQ